MILYFHVSWSHWQTFQKKTKPAWPQSSGMFLFWRAKPNFFLWFLFLLLCSLHLLSSSEVTPSLFLGSSRVKSSLIVRTGQTCLKLLVWMSPVHEISLFAYSITTSNCHIRPFVLLPFIHKNTALLHCSDQDTLSWAACILTTATRLWV